MSGHSKWATIKHKKGAADQKRAKLVFTVKDGKVIVSLIASCKESEEPDQRAEIDMPTTKPFHLYMRAPPGVHDVKYHDIDIKSWVDTERN